MSCIPLLKEFMTFMFLVGSAILSLVEFCSAFSEEKSKISQPIRRHFVFPISPKNTNLVEDVEFLLPGEVSLNSVQGFQRSRKCGKLTTDRRTTDIA